jgi:hypothetical protein
VIQCLRSSEVPLELSESLGGYDHTACEIRPPAELTAHQRREAIQRGEAQTDVARSYAVSQATISRLVPSPFACASAVA